MFFPCIICWLWPRTLHSCLSPFSSSSSNGPIEAKKGNPPVMPAVMTPGGPLGLSSVLFRNRIIFIGQPVNSQVAQRVISQLVTLAAIDENSDILVFFHILYPLHSDFHRKSSSKFIEVDVCLHFYSDLSKLPWWKHIFCFSNIWLHVLGK